MFTLQLLHYLTGFKEIRNCRILMHFLLNQLPLLTVTAQGWVLQTPPTSVILSGNQQNIFLSPAPSYIASM